MHFATETHILHKFYSVFARQNASKLYRGSKELLGLTSLKNIAFGIGGELAQCFKTYLNNKQIQLNKQLREGS